MLAHTAVIGHRVYRLAMKVGTANLPPLSSGVRLKEEGSLCCAYQQKKVTLLYLNVLQTVQDSCGRRASIDACIAGNHHGRLNSFQGCLDFTRAPIPLHRLLYEATLD